MGDIHDIKAPNDRVMSIIITDMCFKYSDGELIQEHKIKVVNSYEYKKYNKIIYNTKITVNKEIYTEVKATQVKIF